MQKCLFINVVKFCLVLSVNIFKMCTESFCYSILLCLLFYRSKKRLSPSFVLVEGRIILKQWDTNPVLEMLSSCGKLLRVYFFKNSLFCSYKENNLAENFAIFVKTLLEYHGYSTTILIGF